MRLCVAVLFLLTVACSTIATTSNEPVDRCDVTNCFSQLRVRNLEIVDDTTMVLYVGSQRCPFKVEFDGIFCDLTFFVESQPIFTTATARQVNTRICSFDRHVGLDGGPFTTASGGDGAQAQNRLPCQILDVASLTDDELIELYVDKGITAPPPPFAAQEIQVKEESAEQEEGTAPPVPEEAGENGDTAGEEPTAAVIQR